MQLIRSLFRLFSTQQTAAVGRGPVPLSQGDLRAVSGGNDQSSPFRSW